MVIGSLTGRSPHHRVLIAPYSQEAKSRLGWASMAKMQGQESGVSVADNVKELWRRSCSGEHGWYRREERRHTGIRSIFPWGLPKAFSRHKLAIMALLLNTNRTFLCFCNDNSPMPSGKTKTLSPLNKVWYHTLSANKRMIPKLHCAVRVPSIF